MFSLEYRRSKAQSAVVIIQINTEPSENAVGIVVGMPFPILT